MAIIPYVNNTTYTGDAVLAETFIQGQSTRSILSALGDYWTQYFTDQDLLKATVSGAVTLYSTQYFRVLDTVLSSNVSLIPVDEPTKYEIKLFSHSDMLAHTDSSGEIVSYSFPIGDAVSIKYLVSSIFDPTVVLEEGIHYVIEGGRIHFVVDIFSDPAIIKGAYSIESSNERYILFWSINVLLDSTTIFDRFGTYLYDYDINSIQYKSLVMALQFFYTQAKTVENIKTIVNVLYGIPYSRYDKEEVITIDTSSDGTILTTNQSVYQIPPFCELLVSIGDILDKFTLLAYWHEVSDYRTSPDWYEGARFPTIITDVTHPDFDIDSRAKKDGDDWEKYLYKLYDTTLKHNLVLLRTNINFSNYEFFRGGASNLYKIIRSGFPVYLYPIIEAIFHIEEYETVKNTAVDTTECTATLKFDESAAVAATDISRIDVTTELVEPAHPEIVDAVSVTAGVRIEDICSPVLSEELVVGVTIHPLDLPTISTMGMLTRNLLRHPINMTNWAAKRLNVSHELSDLVDVPKVAATSVYLQGLFGTHEVYTIDMPALAAAALYSKGLFGTHAVYTLDMPTIATTTLYSQRLFGTSVST